jgi:hypothetical protein
MLATSIERIERTLSDEAVLLDVGGWGKPLARADWVIDLMPYETRGLYGALDPSAERFSAESWVTRDICDHEPWPFADDQFDFVVCSHTLEDIRDPIWVCREMARVARAGYIEVPSRLDEQTLGVNGPWAGWSHHRWLVDIEDGSVDFVGKPGVLHGRESAQLPLEAARALTETERVQTLWWEHGFEARERIFMEPAELDEYLDAAVRGRRPEAREDGRRGTGGLLGRLRQRR